jgi:hypothetical protein
MKRGIWSAQAISSEKQAIFTKNTSSYAAPANEEIIPKIPRRVTRRAIFLSKKIFWSILPERLYISITYDAGEINFGKIV